MGYAPSGYVVDLAKLAALYGSKNTRLGAEIAQSLTELTGWFSKAVAAKRGLMLFTY